MGVHGNIWEKLFVVEKVKGGPFKIRKLCSYCACTDPISIKKLNTMKMC